MAVIDVCTYNGEKDIWDIHHNVLTGYVDEFIVVELDTTFSGKPKELLFPKDEYPNVTYKTFTERDWLKYKDLAESSPNTKGAEHWKLEFMQKECIKDVLTHLKDDDIVFIGDVDEIWDPAFLSSDPFKYGKFQWVPKLKLIVYTYWLNNKSSEEFWGPIVGKYGLIKNKCLNHLRTQGQSMGNAGWHFTSMGGEAELRRKLLDSYTQESYATPLVLEQLGANMAMNKDFLGRDFTYKLDESDWPQYLKDNKDKYMHLYK